MKKRFSVIDKEEPRGQSVADSGIPCTARHCVTNLNRLVAENERLKKEMFELKEDKDKLQLYVQFIQTKFASYEELIDIIQEKKQLKKDKNELLKENIIYKNTCLALDDVEKENELLKKELRRIKDNLKDEIRKINGMVFD